MKISNFENIPNKSVEALPQDSFLKRNFSSKRNWIILVIILILIVYFFFIKVPSTFPAGSLISIEKGQNLSEISYSLKELKVVRSSWIFKSSVRLFSSDSNVIAGKYFFDDKKSIFTIVKKVTRGEYGLTPLKVTVPEGSSIFRVAEIMEENFLYFKSDKFIELARDKEGYLFPDTYFFLPTIEAEQVISEMNRNFFTRIEKIEDDISAFGRPFGDIIIMASILEKEARTKQSRETIAGILWKRLDIGMRLQVDAVFPYINGKNTFELSLKDLEIDSPYNTYKYAGLPVGPITNPGLDSILATINPIKSPYWFYLSDMLGNMHYAQTFEGHKINKAKYLR